MDPTLRQFRSTVAFVLGLEAILFVCGFYGLFPRPPGSADAFTWDMYGSVLKPRYVEASDWLWYIVYIISLIGLFFLWRPARYIASVALIYGVLTTGWSGVRVSAPIDGFIQQVSFVLYLLILGMAHFGRTVSIHFGTVSPSNGT